MLDYFVYSDFVYHAMHNLTVYRIGPQKCYWVYQWFKKYLVNFSDVSENEAKVIFEMNLADWLYALVLPYNCADLMQWYCVINALA